MYPGNKRSKSIIGVYKDFIKIFTGISSLKLTKKMAMKLISLQ
jgi:hypothetical protein